MATIPNTTINLDGEVETTPEETHAQAVHRMIEKDDNLCEVVGYMGHHNHNTIIIETYEARCRMEYDAQGVLQVAKVGGHVVWKRGA